MIIRREYPPMFDEIAAVLPAAKVPGVIFAWAGTVYMPHGGELPYELKAHEQVHFDQQGDDPRAWWKRYLADPQFRLEQELPAHRAEYRTFKRRNIDRNLVSRYLTQVVRRLASPLYGQLITESAARKAMLS